MSRQHPLPRQRGARASALAVALAALALAACGRGEIAHYRVPKSSGTAAPALAPSHAVQPVAAPPAPDAPSPASTASAGSSR